MISMHPVVRQIVVVLPALIVCSIFGDQNLNATESTLDLRIANSLKGFEGKVWIFAKNLETGAQFGLLENERIRTASTIKVPILVALHSMVKEGQLKWDEVVELGAKNRAQGSGVLLEMEDGHKVTLKEASRLMIVVSDNIATNMILDKVTSDGVNAQMEKMGFEKTRSLGRIGGGGKSKAYGEPWNKRIDGSTYGIGVSTPREMVGLLEKMQKGELVSQADSKEMLAILSRQQYHEGVGRTMVGVRRSIKSGALDKLRSDVGILSGPKGKIAFSITVDEMSNTQWSVDNPGLLVLDKVSKILYDGLGAKSSSQSIKPKP